MPPRKALRRNLESAHRGPRAESLIGLHKGRIKIRGDIVSPAGTDLREALGGSFKDFPFSLVYRADPDGIVIFAIIIPERSR